MIQRTKPLQRSTKPIARSPLKRVSKKRAKENRMYLARATAFKLAHPKCEVWLPLNLTNPICEGFTQDIHHVFGRGKYLLVESTWLPVCRACHRYIHDHPDQARTLNLLK